MPHPRRLCNYKPIHIRLLAQTESYLNSIRLPRESNSALIKRIAEEHKEMQIVMKWRDAK